MFWTIIQREMKNYSPKIQLQINALLNLFTKNFSKTNRIKKSKLLFYALEYMFPKMPPIEIDKSIFNRYEYIVKMCCLINN